MIWLFSNKLLLQTPLLTVAAAASNVRGCSETKHKTPHCAHNQVFCSYSGATDDDTSLLECDAVSLGAWFVMLKMNTVPSSSEELSTLT
jgi:hypothetical protein